MGQVWELHGAAHHRRSPTRVVDETLVARPDRACARVARRWVMNTLGAAGLGGAANQVVELLTAELVADAIVRKPEWVRVRATFDGSCARVEVVDDATSTEPDRPRSWSLVEVLAAAWGVLGVAAAGGRTVWFEVRQDG
jgi:hypothetical protein